MECTTCGQWYGWRDPPTTKKCYARRLRRTNVHLSTRGSTYCSFFCRLSIEEYLWYYCLEWWNNLYNPSYTDAIYYGEILFCFCMQLIMSFIFVKKEKKTHALLMNYCSYINLSIKFKWGALQGNAHFYVLFYFGVSEISTGGEFWFCVCVCVSFFLHVELFPS